MKNTRNVLISLIIALFASVALAAAPQGIAQVLANDLSARYGCPENLAAVLPEAGCFTLRMVQSSAEPLVDVALRSYNDIILVQPWKSEGPITMRTFIIGNQLYAVASMPDPELLGTTIILIEYLDSH